MLPWVYALYHILQRAGYGNYNIAESKSSYEVGYGKPPKATQFKKGQSGNPKGRPKGSKNMATYLQEMLNEQVTVREGEQVKRMTKAEAMLQAVAIKAMKGDPKALQTMVNLARQAGQFEKPQEAQQGGGVLVVPSRLELDEWRKQYGEAARGEAPCQQPPKDKVK